MAKLSTSNSTILARFVIAREHSKTYLVIKEVGKAKRVQVLEGNGRYSRNHRLEEEYWRCMGRAVAEAEYTDPKGRAEEVALAYFIIFLEHIGWTRTIR